MDELTMARLAHEARCSVRTVRRWLEDEGSVLPAVGLALEVASERLDLGEGELVLQRGRRRCG